MAAMVEQLVVVLMVVGALGYSLWRLLPPRLWRGLALRAAAAPEQPLAAGPHPGCAGCPAGADCARRR